MENKHTPMRVEESPDPNEGGVMLLDGQGPVGRIWSPQQAHDIVHAVNAHEALVEALIGLESQCFTLGLSRLTEAQREACAKACITARAALALAKEEK